MTNEEIDRKMEEFRKQLCADAKKLADDALFADTEPSEQTGGWIKKSMDGFTKFESESLKTKILKIAAAICRRHAHIKGNMICQDWLGDRKVIDALTQEEKDILAKEYEDFNSGGEDFEPGQEWHDEMMISEYIATAIDKIIEREII